MRAFELAIIGPTAVRSLGIAEGCTECRRSQGDAAPVCTGFGAGCLGMRAPRPEVKGDDPGEPRG